MGKGLGSSSAVCLARALRSAPRIVRYLALSAVALVHSAAAIAASSDGQPIGCAVPGVEAFDGAMTQLLEKWSVPGGSLVVALHGRLLLAHGYGIADRATGAPVTPDTRFRLGSLAKPVTAVATMQLVDAGRLRLDQPVLPLLAELGPPPSLIRDERVHKITVRHLLEHSGGFDRDKSGDPVFMPRAAAALWRQHTVGPPTCKVVLRDVLEDHLDFDPGTRHAYSNIGYCILGRVIERAAGVPLEEYIRRNVLDPSGAGAIRMGSTRRRQPGEAAYYDYPGAPPVDAMPGIGSGRVMAPYGAFANEAMDAYGGWVGTT
jgi:N-acyl-D-amino-acid deacylase